MIRTLSKVNSSSKLEEPVTSLPITNGSKFRRTSKKQSIEETNATSERASSLLQQELSPPSTIRQTITRTNRQEQRQDSRGSSQISDPFSNVKTNSSKIKTEPDEVPQRPNFIKKNNTNFTLGSTLSPETQHRALKSTMSPRANITKNTAQSAETESIASQIKPSLHLKRSSVFLFVVERLMRQKMAASLKVLLQNKRTSKIRQQRQTWVLILAMSGLYARLQSKLKREVINRCKMVTAKQGKEVFLIQHQMMKINNKKMTDSLPNLLHFLFRSKLKRAFAALVKNRTLKKAISSCYPTLLNFYQRRKIKSAFQVFKRSANLSQQRRSVLMGEVQSAYKFCVRLSLAEPFKKMNLFSYSHRNVEANSQKSLPQSKPLLKSNSSQLLSPRQSQFESRKQRIGMEIQRIGREANEVTQKMAQQRRVTDGETKKMKKNIEQLTKKHEEMKQEVNEKQQVNLRLKQQTESLPKLQCPIDEDASSSQSSLPILQQFYSEISKASQADFLPTLQRLLKEQKIAIPSHQNQQIQAWLLLGQKQALQGQIDAYESQILGHAGVGESRINRAMREQSAMVVQMIKNYIKQRYLWGEVQRFVSKVL